MAAEDAQLLFQQEQSPDSYFASLRAGTAAALAKAAPISPRSGDCGSTAPPVEPKS